MDPRTDAAQSIYYIASYSISAIEEAVVVSEYNGNASLDILFNFHDNLLAYKYVRYVCCNHIKMAVRSELHLLSATALYTVYTVYDVFAVFLYRMYASISLVGIQYQYTVPYTV